MLTTQLTEQIIETMKEESTRFSGVKLEIEKHVVGHQDIIQFMIIALLCEGHILLEGVPGVAKTTMVKATTEALGLQFNRIQFTPDLLPSDLIGTLIYNPKTMEFETKKGPIFAHLILADEINRAPAKVQAALLEAMQERQVTIGSCTYQLEKPFLVFATQNPIEQEGTYRLPEAQIDRFMFKLLVGYPTKEQEREIIAKNRVVAPINPVLTREELLKAHTLVNQIYIDEKVIQYIIDVVLATRNPGLFQRDELVGYIQHGASPRATLALERAARARAFLKKRHFVTPEDVKIVAPAVLRHRLILTYQAEAEYISVDQIIEKILNTVPTP